MNPNGLSTGVVRVKDATIAVNNKAQKSTDTISSFEDDTTFLTTRHTVRDAPDASSYDRLPAGDNKATATIQNR
jgi:hypothetical protein